ERRPHPGADASGGSVGLGLSRWACSSSSVEGAQSLIDLDGSPQGPAERAPRGRPLEARKAAARVGAAAAPTVSRDEPRAVGREPEQLSLRCLPAAADTAP